MASLVECRRCPESGPSLKSGSEKESNVHYKLLWCLVLEEHVHGRKRRHCEKGRLAIAKHGAKRLYGDPI